MASPLSLSRRLDISALPGAPAPKRPAFSTSQHCDPYFEKPKYHAPPSTHASPVLTRNNTSQPMSRSVSHSQTSQLQQQPSASIKAFIPGGISSSRRPSKQAVRAISTGRSPSISRPLTPQGSPMRDSLALRLVKEVTRRPNELEQQQEELKAAKVKRMLDMRYNMVVEANEEGSGVMKRVPRSGLRVEYYARNRKRTVNDLHSRRGVPTDKVHMVACRQATGPFVCGPLTAHNVDLILGCIGDNEEALHHLGLTCPSFSESVQAKLLERNVQVNAAVRARASLVQGRKDVERIPKSYFKAIQSVKGELPERVSFVLALVVQLLEKSARLSSNPVARNSQTAEVFRSYLASGSVSDTVGLITSLDPHSVPMDTVDATAAGVAKGMRELGVQTETQLLLSMRSYNEHTESLLKWVLAVLTYHRELSPN